MKENSNKDSDQSISVSDNSIGLSNNVKIITQKQKKNYKNQKNMNSVFDIKNQEDQFDIPP